MVLSIRPMQWANLPELHQTPRLDDSDLDCLEEIRDVLPRHGKSARFAVHLAHRHFELAPGEILIERPDPDARIREAGRRPPPSVLSSPSIVVPQQLPCPGVRRFVARGHKGQ
jgi:hypothetical protein